jgi:hypothetical protein
MSQLNLEEVIVAQTLVNESIGQIVREMSKTSGAGGSGRLQSFAPALVHLSWANDVLENMKTSLAPVPEIKQSKKG